MSPKATPELGDPELSAELSQYLFDTQMACHHQKHPVTVLPNEAVYDPPNLPSYVPVELKSVTGPPSNKESSSVHTALRILESFANVPSIFDPDAHAELSQHLFDIQLARHVQRSVMKQFKSTPPTSKPSASHEAKDASDCPGRHETPETPSLETTGSTKPHPLVVEEPNPPEEVPSRSKSGEIGDLSRTNELIVELKESLKIMTRILVGSQNSLARGFNSSTRRSAYSHPVYDLGAHSLINDHGEVPEEHNLPTFQSGPYIVSFPFADLNENTLAQYLRFYDIGEELIEEGEEVTVKPGMVEEAMALLSKRLCVDY
ncbi:hypothetical protein V565_270130 [Rhizoctonia solani 123E]|uniref:Laminin domain protein n=1 Tax=Rhizoctonia solani 123E TaxID=1423351 RepID=A0A074REA6_9AGAM|nr:hypothetical protein V565_270130 [Rhizoctonia solani 123E]